MFKMIYIFLFSQFKSSMLNISSHKCILHASKKCVKYILSLTTACFNRQTIFHITQNNALAKVTMNFKMNAVFLNALHRV